MNETMISRDEVNSLDQLFRLRCERTPEAPAYRGFDTESKQWHDWNWRETANEVGRWQVALAREGLKPGDRVALNLRNSTQWVHFEQAALGLGLVVVPLYTDDRADNIAYILEETTAHLLLVQDEARWRRLIDGMEAGHKGLPELRRVVVLEGVSNPEDERTRAAADWLPEGDSFPVNERADTDSNALATIVFTSGTVGRPKGVMLSHRNLIANTFASHDRAPIDASDRLLSFLPLAHMYERTGGYYLPMLIGAEVCYARSIAQLSRDLEEQQPTVFFSVPRIFERILARLQEQLKEAPVHRRWIFRLAVAAGWRRFEYRQGRAGWSPLLWLAPLGQRLVGDKLMAKLGGRLRFVGTGGAPLSYAVARTFIGLGLPLFQGYGMTEASPIICGNRPDDNDPTTIGHPLEGVEIRLGENDELLARGDSVMLGYWNNHAATADTIDSEGWLHTGDQASIAPSGHVRITGRIKDILVLSNGEKVPPADMELAIAADPLFEQVMVVGEGRSYLAALLVLNGELWPAFAQECGVDPLEPASLHDKGVLKAVQRRIREQLHAFPGYAKIRRVDLSLEPWSIDNGLLTPTLKVKRPKVLERYGARVEALYQ